MLAHATALRRKGLVLPATTVNDPIMMYPNNEYAAPASARMEQAKYRRDRRSGYLRRGVTEVASTGAFELMIEHWEMMLPTTA